MTKKLFLLFIFFNAVEAYGAGLSDDLSYARDLYQSPGFLSRGDTGLSLADEEEALFYNPAGLAQGKGIYKKTVLASPVIEISQATRDTVRRIVAEDSDAIDTVRESIGKANHLGVQQATAVVLRRAAIGVWGKGDTDLLAYKNHLEGGLETVELRAKQTTGVVFGLAESFFKGHMLMGASGKYLVRGLGAAEATAADTSSVKEKFKDKSQLIGYGDGFGGDFGVMFQSLTRVGFNLGVTVQDIGDTRILPKEETSLSLHVKQSVNVGVAIVPGTKFSKMKLLAEAHDVLGVAVKNPYKRLHLGGELSIRDAFGVLAGLRHGYGTGGAYLDLYVLRVDLGFYTEETSDTMGLRPDTRYFVGVKVGF